MDNTKLYRKEGQSQVVDAQGNLQSYTGNLDSLPIYNQSTITASSLQPQPKTQLPEEQTPPVTPTSQPNLTTSYLDELKLNANEKEAQDYQTKGISQLIQDTLALEGEKITLAEEQKRAGVGTLRQDLQNINSQILKKTAEVNQDDITLVANLRAEERRDTLLPFAEMGKAKLAGDAMIVRALKNAEIGVLNATALAKQGDIALAKETAQEAVDVKYAPYKARIERYNTIVNALKPYLDAAEKKELAKQTFKGNTALKEIEKVSDYQKTILANAISNNAPSGVLNAISKASSIDEITSAGKGYLQSASDKLELELKRAQIDSANRANREKSGEDLNKLLTLKEAQDAGVPYGTTYAQLIAKGDTGGELTAERGLDRLKQVRKLSAASVGLATSAGSLRGAPIPFFKKNAINNWRAEAVNVMSRLTVDELGRVKADGVTFGGLSNGEREAVGAAASILLSGSIKDKEGNPTGKFKISEKRVSDAFKEIEKYQELDFIRRTGKTSEQYELDKYLEQTDTALQTNGAEYNNYE